MLCSVFGGSRGDRIVSAALDTGEEPSNGRNVQSRRTSGRLRSEMSFNIFRALLGEYI